MIEQVHGVDAMSSYKFIEREIVTPLSNDMFITGEDLADMLHKLEQSSELERFSKGSQVGFATMWGLSDVTTLEDTSQLEPHLAHGLECRFSKISRYSYYSTK